MSIAFFACIERGPLEAMGLLFVESLRRWGGRYANAPIHTFQPRAGTQVSADTAAKLRDLGVTHVTETLNTRWTDYGLANKVVTAAWAERHIDADVLVWVDSDSLFLGEPSELDIPPGTAAAARPVDRKRQGSTGPGDPNDAYWKTAYELCGVAGAPRLRTTVDGEDIRAYYNSGFYAVRREEGLLARWADCFTRILDAGLRPADGRIAFVEQTALSVAFAVAHDRIRLLSDRCNYPLPLRRKLPAAMRSMPLESLVHVHYHKMFHEPDPLGRVEPAFDIRSEQYRWLAARLPLPS